MKKLGLFGLIFAMLGAAPAMAADLSVEPAPVAPTPVVNDWRFQATLYGWATGINGDVGVRGLGPVDVNVSASEAISDLHGAFMGSFGGNNDNWMFLTDFVWARVSDSGQVGNKPLNYEYTQNQAIVQGIVGYRLPINVDKLTVNGTLGFRYMYLDGDLGLGIVGLPNSASASGSEQWIDPTVGLNVRYDFNDKWFVNALGDIGGFGVGSDLTWQAFGAVGYNWSKTISTSLGYRAIYEDYSDGGFVYKTTQQGVMAGIGIHF
ncbi:hypothetical protein OSH11_07490 [Kaistia dalseonensis]|uniref:Outer membrane protein beta-barrel domain-containing protein n=1 Tax=Kaistia dalseonensis TaxID=410840 RepID=A0ABU0H481_9HYPH|nr:hypothetical protein [Kaistia dalseonensis]MCX5494539.1 hypothetical protein [Kaistia dalseonensis]MDQ0437118.1 hypothetical protein [Kaistia dalseonensis]